MSEALHRKVKIKYEKEGRGSLTIDFFSKDDLTDIAKQLCGY